MKHNYLNLLFSASLDILLGADAQIQTKHKINNDYFLILHKIISDVTEIIYKILLKDAYRTLKHQNSLYIELDPVQLRKGTILLSVFFNPHNAIDNTGQEATINHEILFAAAEIFIIQSYAHNFNYCQDLHLTESHMWDISSSPPVIQVKHKSSIELLNKLEPSINKMYSINENLEINIQINNKELSLLPIKKSTIAKEISVSSFPEMIDGYVLYNHPINGLDNFLFKKEGSNYEFRLTNTTQKQCDELALKAVSKEKIRLSVFPSIKMNRGIKEKSNKLFLDEIIHNNEKGQLPLIIKQ